MYLSEIVRVLEINHINNAAICLKKKKETAILGVYVGP